MRAVPAMVRMIVALVLMAALAGSKPALAQGSVNFVNEAPTNYAIYIFNLDTNLTGSGVVTLTNGSFLLLTNFPYQSISNLIGPGGVFASNGAIGALLGSNVNVVVAAWTGDPATVFQWTNSLVPLIFATPLIPLPPVPPAVSPPPNDNFADAIDVSGSAFSAKSTNTMATAELGEPDPAEGRPAAHSSWWRWTPDYDADTVITLTAVDGVMAVYTGDNLATLARVPITTALATNVLSPPVAYGYSQKTVTFHAAQGAVYYLAVDSASVVSWKLEEQTLSLTPAEVNDAHVGEPVAIEAISKETLHQPLTVSLVLMAETIGPVSYAQPASSGGIVINLFPVELLPVPLEQVGIATAPPYQFTWVPRYPGRYLLRAYSTNSAGEVHESSSTRVEVKPQNDNFVDATEIWPSTVDTNFTCALQLATAEANEPSRPNGPAVNTLWWKWTPSSSGKVRLRVSRLGYAIPIEVFSGTDLRHLQLVSQSQASGGTLGKSGIVYSFLKAGRTYYIRVGETGGGPAPVARTDAFGPVAPDTSLTIEPMGARLPGEVNFSLFQWNRSGTSHHPVIPFARVFQPDGRTPVVGSNYRAQLYVGVKASELAACGLGMPFYETNSIYGPATLYGSALAGLFQEGTIVQLPNISGGQRFVAQVRVWDSNAGQTFEDAQAAGGAVGKSKIVTLIAGSELTGPTPLYKIGNFKLREAP